jgi:hypothetical protein
LKDFFSVIGSKENFFSSSIKNSIYF